MQLVVSINTYNWINHTFGKILENPSRTDVVVVYDDSNIDPDIVANLCRSAIVEQRRCDLRIAGKELGIRKLKNLNYVILDAERFLIQMQFDIALGGYKKIFCDGSDENVKMIMAEIARQYKVRISYFNCDGIPDFTKILTKDEYNRKVSLIHKLVGKYGIDEICGMEKFFV